jgi:predicted alpha-1,2-mannosidase
MIGDHGVSIIGDAIMKDIPGFDYEEAYELMRKNAFTVNTDRQSYIDGKGRRAMKSYLDYGYIPLEDEVTDAFHKREQVSRTLEYAYNDYVLSQVARKMGKMEDYKALAKRMENYRYVIDPETGFARGRYADGRWIETFDPYKPASFICEGTPFHYTWYVPQDVGGLRSILGKERFSQRLNEFFDDDHYWHGNEPGHHIPYLFAMADEAWKTQEWVHKIINREYFITPDGMSGNDDAGQMSAWLVFSMMGFYPVCPGTGEYVIGSPSFPEVNIHLSNGKTFTIKANRTSNENIYIQSATKNGISYHKNYITHEDILSGATFVFEMGKTPNKDWGSSEEATPYSMSKKKQ